MPRTEAEILDSIRRCGERFRLRHPPRLSRRQGRHGLADPPLLAVLAAINEHLPGVRRIASYTCPQSAEEIAGGNQDLAAAGLSLVYVGAESGTTTSLAQVEQGDLRLDPRRPWKNSAVPGSGGR